MKKAAPSFIELGVKGAEEQLIYSCTVREHLE
jgi:hypothetical protein